MFLYVKVNSQRNLLSAAFLFVYLDVFGSLDCICWVVNMLWVMGLTFTMPRL